MTESDDKQPGLERRRSSDQELLDRLDRMEHALRRRYAVLVIALLIAGAVSAKAEVDASNQRDRITRALIDRCRNQRERNIATVGQLRLETDQREARNPKLRASLELSYQGAKALIDDLAPVIPNCMKAIEHPHPGGF